MLGTGNIVYDCNRLLENSNLKYHRSICWCVHIIIMMSALKHALYVVFMYICIEFCLSHYMCPLLPNNANLVNHIPVLQTVFDNSTIKWILVLSICCPKVPIASIIGSLVSCKIEDNRIKLKEKLRHHIRRNALCLIQLYSTGLHSEFGSKRGVLVI